MKIQLSDKAKQTLSGQKHEDPFNFNKHQPQRPVKQNFSTPTEPRGYSSADREWWWRPILKWVKQYRQQLLDLGWTDEELRTLLRFKLWKDAGDAFMDARDCSLNIVDCDGEVRCFYPNNPQPGN